MEMIFIHIASSLLNLQVATTELRQNAPIQYIDKINWEAFSYKPTVSFQAGWNTDGLLIHFQVEEQHILAANIGVYGPAYQDSCVEFFYSPNSNGDYYNLEMNCVGTILWHYKENGQKTIFPDEKLSKMIINTSLPSHTAIDNPEGGKWELTVFIPKENLPEDFLKSGKEFTANFYKCGDNTREKHYLTWSAIGTEKPSFHQPQYFGKVTLQ